MKKRGMKPKLGARADTPIPALRNLGSANGMFDRIIANGSFIGFSVLQILPTRLAYGILGVIAVDC